MKTTPIALALLSCSLGCSITPPPNIRPQAPNVVSLAPENWYIFYSAGMPLHPLAGTGAAWWFGFPNSDTGGHVNYVQTPFNATATPVNVSITFRVESSPFEGHPVQYKVLDPTDIPPATVHVFFEEQNDDLVNPNGRWWASASGYDLGSQDGQTIVFNVPLTSDQWSNVDGQQDPQAFSAALANIGWIGLTYGGQYFWGHGVAMVGGVARYILVDFQVN
jgi:hypothetical protein